MEKVYLILGASSDLGCALIKQIALKEDDSITILAHYNSSNASILDIVAEHKSLKFHTLKADLSDLVQTQEMVEHIKKLNLEPTHIINFSAQAYKFNRLAELDINRLNNDMAIQVYSFALICQAFIPGMVNNKYGKIVAILSAATKGEPPKNTTEYTTVKYALLGLVKSLAADYGNLGINVNAVSPGMIETKFIKSIGRKIKEFTAEKNPRHRNLEVDDVIPTIELLLSDDSQFMNGANLNLTGYSD